MHPFCANPAHNLTRSPALIMFKICYCPSAVAIMGELRERVLECREMGECMQFFSAFNSGSTSVLEDAHAAGGRAGVDVSVVQPAQLQAATGSPERVRPRPASTNGLELVIGAAGSGSALSPAAESAAAPLMFDMRACLSNALRMYQQTPPSLYRAMVEEGATAVSPLGFAAALGRRRSSAPQGGRRVSGAALGRARVSSTSAGFGDTMLLCVLAPARRSRSLSVGAFRPRFVCRCALWSLSRPAAGARLRLSHMSAQSLSPSLLLLRLRVRMHLARAALSAAFYIHVALSRERSSASAPRARASWTSALRRRWRKRREQAARAAPTPPTCAASPPLRGSTSPSPPLCVASPNRRGKR